MRSHRQGYWSRYLKSTAIAASLVLAGCGLKPGESAGDGSQTENDDLSLTKSLLVDDGGILKKPNMPSYSCVDQVVSSPALQSVAPLSTRVGTLEVHLRSSTWTKSMDEVLFSTGQSAVSGAGFRILSSNGGQSPVSAPWSGVDQIILTSRMKMPYSPMFDLFGRTFGIQMLGVKTQLQKLNSDGSLDSVVPLKIESKATPFRSGNQAIYAYRIILDRALSPGTYRLILASGKQLVDLRIYVQPGDINSSFSVDAIDQDFIERNVNKSLASISNQSHLQAMIKADLNADGQVDKLDLQTFKELNPDAGKLTSDFLGDHLNASTGDILSVGVRGGGWWSAFLRTPEHPVGMVKVAPASCLRSLPWQGINQIVLTSGTDKPLSGTITLSDITGGSEKALFTQSLETSPRFGKMTFFFMRSMLRVGVFKIKINLNNSSNSLDGVTTRIIRFHVLQGDVDGNYIVDANDVTALSQNIGHPTSNRNNRFDINGNNKIDPLDLMAVKQRVGLMLLDPSIPAPPITELNKVHITDENGNFLPGSVSATINGQSVAKVELNGQDAAMISVAGALGSKVLWSNSLTGDTIETILDGKGDYDGRGHYVTFKVQSSPGVQPDVQPDVQPEQPPVTEINKVYIKDGNGRMVPGVIAATIDGKTVAKVQLNGKDAESVDVTGAFGSKVVWINNLSSDTFETTLDGKGDYGQGHLVVFNLISSSEKGGCGRHFGDTAGSFSSTKDECFMKQEDIDATCKNFSGQAYKVNWTRFNADNTVKEVLNLQNGVCQKLPAPPPTYVDSPNSAEPTPNPNPAPAAKVGVGFETGSDMDFNDVYACMPSGQFNVNGREIISARDQTVPIYFGNIASESNVIIVKAFMSGQLIVERHIPLVPRQQSAGKTVLELPKGSTVTFQLRGGIVQADPRRTVIDVNTCRSGS